VKAEIHWIRGVTGRLGIMPRPRAGEWLEDELRLLKQQGVDVLVSMLTDDEIAELDLQDEARFSEAADIRFMRLPVEDRSVPPDGQSMLEMAGQLVAELGRGAGVAVHCRAGVGRSAMLLACVLMKMGKTTGQALDMIAAARGCPVPDTDEQRQRLMRLERIIRRPLP